MFIIVCKWILAVDLQADYLFCSRSPRGEQQSCKRMLQIQWRRSAEANFVIFSSIRPETICEFAVESAHSIRSELIRIEHEWKHTARPIEEHLIRIFFVQHFAVLILLWVVIVAGIFFHCEVGNRRFIVSWTLIVFMSTQFRWLENMIDYRRPNERPFIYFSDSKNWKWMLCRRSRLYIFSLFSGI